MKNKEKKIKKYIDIINKIQKTRSKNNVNWMNILKIAIKNSPEETIQTMKKINDNDNKITNLFKKMSNEK
jgi:hypothetical protein